MQHKPLRAVALAGLLASGCTLGNVVWGGDTVANVDVTVRTCEDGSFTTVTDEEGVFVFDGHSDWDEAIPPGVILIDAELPGGIHKKQVDAHEYTPCPDEPDKFCSFHQVNFGLKPASAWEYNAWKDALADENVEAEQLFHEACHF